MEDENSHRRSTAFVLGAALLSTFSVSAQTPRFSVQTLSNVSNGTYAYVYGLNNAGQAVGEVSGSASVCPNACPVVWNGITPTLLATVQGANGYGPLAINNLGQVAGTAGFPNFTVTNLAVTWINGAAILLPAPTAQFNESFAAGINDSGVIVGFVQGGNNIGGGVAVVATVWDDLEPTLLTTIPGCGAESSALGINDNGLVAGYVDCYGYVYEPAVLWRDSAVELLQKVNDPSPRGIAGAVNNLGLAVGNASPVNIPGAVSEAAAWPQGVLTYLGILPNGIASSANAVNSLGVIVGESSVSDQYSDTHAIFWAGVDAPMQDLNDLIGVDIAQEIVLTTATGINDRCVIVANGYNKKKNLGSHFPTAFLLTPTNPSQCISGRTLTRGVYR